MAAKIALSSNEFRDDAAKAFEVAVEHGIGFLEVWQGWTWQGQDIVKAAPDWKAAGVNVACVSSWSQLNKLAEVQERILATIETAAAVGAPFVNTYYGINEDLSDEDALDVYRERIGPALELARKLGVTVLLENEFDTEPSPTGRHEFTGRARNCLKLFQAIDADNFGLTYDPCNFYIAGEEGFPFAYELLKKHIRYVHVKNACLHDDGLYGPKAQGAHASGECLYVPGPDGAVNLSGLLDRLHGDGYDGFLCLEPHDTRDLPGNIRKTLEFVRRHPLCG